MLSEPAMLTLEHRIDRAHRLLRMIEDDAPLLAVRIAPLSPERQKSAKSYARDLAKLTRAEIRKLMKEKDSADAIESMPTAAD
ncbi:MAG TPA: hypothetical protein VGL74_02585 [Terriglobales bacterium]|jgi:hypothetical protein